MAYKCCWFNPGRNIKECPNIEEGEEYLFTSPRKRLVEKCINCKAFQDDIAQLSEESPLRKIIVTLCEEYKEQKGHLQSLSAFLTSKSREIKFLHELSLVLQTSMELDEVLSVAMTAITSGKGFGMNRAFLLMTDRDRKYLVGHLGVGPRNYEEAWRIWDEVDRSNFSLTELSKEFYKTKISFERAKFQDILEKLTIPRDLPEHIFNRALNNRRPILVENASQNPEIDPVLVSTLGVEQFLVMPLISRNRSIGILLADNFVTNKPITPRDMQSLQTFAFPVAFAIERASLYERLNDEVEKQAEANQKLKEQQELIVRMENMAVVGRITSSIAHSIRNPLAAIGGYARSLMKSGDLDEKKEYLEQILQKAKQLDEVLEEVLSYSDSLHPVIDCWDLNHLAGSVAAEMEERFEENGLTIVLNLDADLPRVWLDYKQIAYCLKTIINHIALGLSESGTIEVETSRSGESVRLCVTDKAVTLSDEMKKALMTPFMETAELGQGVGLPLCKVILERHGSSFDIEALQGGGTRYCIILQKQKEDKES
ncbi:MAG TPA: histidine kinase dimerization/phospho-acceptor domain-containing protein [Geobacteraceae bacterium]|nr:histidine kinase dimerization/phospho-acceptor domain-containing protein [Geobacteraceae bacterium]